mmetsp:Transcript_3732/g.13105  ORF Transcript_3732/g.13105 Transcript_3732/m.13105 type:complete len:297 (-) Transcript_3732:231-1121(-)
MLVVLRLHLGEVLHHHLPRCHVLQVISEHVQVLEHDQGLHGAHLHALQGVFHPEDVLPGVFADLVEELADELLFLNELDVGEGVRGELDGLAEPVLTAIRHIDDAHDHRLQPLVEHITLAKDVLEVGGTGEDEPRNVRPVVGDEHLNGGLGDLPDVVVPLLQTETRKTEGGLTSTAVLLGQLHSKLVQDLAVVPAQGSVEGPVTVHHNEAVPLVALQELAQSVRVELVVAKVQRGVDWLEGLEVDVELLLLSLIRDDGSAVNHQAVWWDLVVQLQTLLRRCDGPEDGQAVHSALDV